jgi:pimeloyl-ACP methyl ester carboxylesterase
MMRDCRLTIADDQGALSLGYVEWGDPAARVVLCLHGLTRNARDFDRLAEALAPDRRVICLDVAGRGRSGWLVDASRYATPVYARQVATFLAALGLAEVDLVGTSMGGIIGMGLAGLRPSPVRRLVLNDVGALVPKAALAPIGAYLGGPPKVFADVAALEQHLRFIHQGFGPLTDAQWAHLARHSARALPAGITQHYDPAIAVNFKAGVAADIELWPLYDAIAAPTLVLRGGDSQLLPADVAAAMTRRGPRAEIVTFAGIGHAPALMAADQIDTVRRFLLA